MKYFLGIELARSSKGIILSQRKYVLDLLSNAGMSGCKPSTIPMPQNLRLIAYEEGRHEKEDLLPELERYRRLVGRLIYLTVTRTNISFCVQGLSQFMHQPTKTHTAAAMGVLKYLKRSPGLGILLRSEGELKLRCFCDSDWGSCATTRCSVTGYLLKLGGSLVMWKTKKQATVSKSSTEAECRALGAVVSEISLLGDLGIKHSDPVNVHCDNKSAIHIANNPVFHERTKYIEIDCHLLREKLQQGLISLTHVKSAEQEADILTKPVGKEFQTKILSKLGVGIFTPNLRGNVNNISHVNNVNTVNTICNFVLADSVDIIDVCGP